ncbi:MAG: hypothetical protein PHE83_18900, partial [Opitutaceae bacterium]|nr:hypothetical protein [Opitutaceae bacterium]
RVGMAAPCSIGLRLHDSIIGILCQRIPFCASLTNDATDIRDTSLRDHRQFAVFHNREIREPFPISLFNISIQR